MHKLFLFYLDTGGGAVRVIYVLGMFKYIGGRSRHNRTHWGVFVHMDTSVRSIKMGPLVSEHSCSSFSLTRLAVLSMCQDNRIILCCPILCTLTKLIAFPVKSLIFIAFISDLQWTGALTTQVADFGTYWCCLVQCRNSSICWAHTLWSPSSLSASLSPVRFTHLYILFDIKSLATMCESLSVLLLLSWHWYNTPWFVMLHSIFWS